MKYLMYAVALLVGCIFISWIAAKFVWLFLIIAVPYVAWRFIKLNKSIADKEAEIKKKVWK